MSKEIMTGIVSKLNNLIDCSNGFRDLIPCNGDDYDDFDLFTRMVLEKFSSDLEDCRNQLVKLSSKLV